MSIGMNITNTIDLQKPLEVRRLATLLGADDYKANSFILTVVDGGEPVALDGYSVMAVLVRADGYGVALTGSIDGNVVRVTLEGACYNVAGSCYIVIKLHNGEETRTIYKATAYVDETDGAGFVDENVHTTFDALVESIIAKYLEENPIAGGGIKVETDPTVPAWAKQENPPTYTAADVGLGNVDNVRQYSADNPPPYPVTSVNGMTGNVIINTGGGGTGGDAAAEIAAHNADESAHTDIRENMAGIAGATAEALTTAKSAASAAAANAQTITQMQEAAAVVSGKVDTLSGALVVTADAIDIGNRYIDNARFR